MSDDTRRFSVKDRADGVAGVIPSSDAAGGKEGGGGPSILADLVADLHDGQVVTTAPPPFSVCETGFNTKNFDVINPVVQYRNAQERVVSDTLFSPGDSVYCVVKLSQDGSSIEQAELRKQQGDDKSISVLIAHIPDTGAITQHHSGVLVIDELVQADDRSIGKRQFKFGDPESLEEGQPLMEIKGWIDESPKYDQSLPQILGLKNVGLKGYSLVLRGSNKALYYLPLDPDDSYSPGPSGSGPSGSGPSGSGPSGSGPSGSGPSGSGPSGDGPSGDGPSGDGPSGDGPSGDGPSGGSGAVLTETMNVVTAVTWDGANGRFQVDTTEFTISGVRLSVTAGAPVSSYIATTPLSGTFQS